ncbi:carbohydrate kinase family protein [Longimycelium tulufanense]|uniref:carbohydrate kinase family protein n=1 Tax=Longimycelium tulufanense TaxID=907463 RepID=UPI00166ABF14|nr:PfkB family carbohydrate kinase [Longimycelium tulufanense]
MTAGTSGPNVAEPEWAQALRDTAAAARVLVVGSLNVDLLLQAESPPGDEGAVVVHEVSTAVGGHAGNCASALAALGIAVHLLGAVGRDADGDLILSDLTERGIDASAVRRHPTEPTGRVIIPIFGAEHYMLLCRGANETLTARDTTALELSGFDAVVLFDPSLEALRGVVEAVSAAPQRPLLCWNPGGVYVRNPVATEVVPHCDVLFLNRNEYEHLRARTHLEQGGNGPEVVVTLGAAGSRLLGRADPITVPGHPTTMVDPVGAGDAFAASYLLAKLARLEPENRLSIGNVAGALAVSATGARARLARIADLVAAQARSIRHDQDPSGPSRPRTADDRSEDNT